MKILFFHADWAEPSKRMKSDLGFVLDWDTMEVKENEWGITEIEEILVDDNPERCRKHKVRGVPTLILYDGEEMVKWQTGYTETALDSLFGREDAPEEE